MPQQQLTQTHRITLADTLKSMNYNVLAIVTKFYDYKHITWLSNKGSVKHQNPRTHHKCTLFAKRCAITSGNVATFPMGVSNTVVTEQTNVHPLLRVRRKILFIASLTLIGFLAYNLPPLLIQRFCPKGPSSGYTLDKPACKMYEIDPFEASVNRYLEYRALQKCRRPLIYSSGEVQSELLLEYMACILTYAKIDFYCSSLL